jgi:hypothetical protein
MIKDISRLATALFLSWHVAGASTAAADTNKPVVAVGDFDSSFPNYDTKNIQTAIETALSQSGKYALMERGRLDQLLAEQGRSAAGLTQGSAQMGGFEGIDYLIYGRITQLSLESQNLLLLTQCNAHFGLDVRVVDVQSGEIRLSKTIKEEEGVATGQAQQDPCSGVTFSSLDQLSTDAARQIVEGLSQTLFPVKIAKVSSDEVYLNYGEGFLNKDEVMKVTSLGEGFVDPDTGEMLGAEETVIAIIQVADIREKYSTAKVLMNAGGLKVGDVVRRIEKADGRDLQKQLKACTDASKARDSNCAKGSKRCDQYKDKAKLACDILG